MQRFSSLLQAVEYFRTETDYVPFNLKGDTIEHPDTLETFSMTNSEIVDSIKLEASSDADGVSLIHIVKVDDGTIGYFIDASGIYSSLEHPEKW
ncbi:MAG TPA: hypothetical protein PLZ32_05015 [Saprospiraceae bacterium]|nr:hypothetical protein [Saprospiraceae bacterium]